MHTLAIIVSGLVLLAVILFIGRQVGASGNAAMANAALIFIPIWLAASLVNMWFGVAKAGYTVRDELPIMLIVFALPAAVAAFLWWKWSRG